MESHFRWQIRTFWFTALWLVVYGLLIITIIGIPIAWILIALLGLWVGYRVIRGWVALFGEPLSGRRFAGLVLVVARVVSLSLAGPAH